MSHETFDSVSEAIGFASAFTPSRYVASSPWGRYAVFQIGERPCGCDEDWPHRPWPLEQISVFLPPAYLEVPGSEVQAFTREPAIGIRVRPERARTSDAELDVSDDDEEDEIEGKSDRSWIW